MKLIYDEFLAGKGYSEIAHRLEQLGAKTGAGKAKWNESAIRRILANEKYVGDVITQKGFTRDFLTHERLRNDGQLPQYIAEGITKQSLTATLGTERRKGCVRASPISLPRTERPPQKRASTCTTATAPCSPRGSIAPTASEAPAQEHDYQSSVARREALLHLAVQERRGQRARRVLVQFHPGAGA